MAKILKIGWIMIMIAGLISAILQHTGFVVLCCTLALHCFLLDLTEASQNKEKVKQ